MSKNLNRCRCTFFTIISSPIWSKLALLFRIRMAILNKRMKIISRSGTNWILAKDAALTFLSHFFFLLRFFYIIILKKTLLSFLLLFISFFPFFSLFFYFFLFFSFLFWIFIHLVHLNEINTEINRFTSLLGRTYEKIDHKPELTRVNDRS